MNQRMVILPESSIHPESQETVLEEDTESQNQQQGSESLSESVLKNEKQAKEQGRIVNELFNQGLSSMQVDSLFSQMVQNPSNAQQIYGETLLRELTGYGGDSLRRNVKIPEFQRELKGRLKTKVRELEDSQILDEKGFLTEKAVEYGAYQLYIDELDSLVAHGIRGEHEHTFASNYGQRDESRPYKKGDSYKNVSVQKTIRKAIRRGDTQLQPEHLVVSQRQSKGEITMIYAIDSSGSMRGKKIQMAKKAGVALAYKASMKKDKVGLLVFAQTIQHTVAPTTNFSEIVESLTKIRVEKQTDIALAIKESFMVFGTTPGSKHLLILTDAQATVGKDPFKDALEQAEFAKSHDITISIVGVGIEKDVETFALELTVKTGGKLYNVSNLDDMDAIILQDYEEFSQTG